MRTLIANETAVAEPPALPATGQDERQSRRRTKTESAKILRVSIKSLERRMRTGQIGYAKDGRLVFFTDEDLENYLQSRHVRACGIKAR